MRTESIGGEYADASACAERAGLRYVSDTDPGIRRRRCGHGFSYVDSHGRRVSGAVRVKLTQLAVPPAWRDVWLCADPIGHLLATGVDQRGRKQYLYHPQWRACRDAMNFARLVPFADRLPTVRATVTAHLRRRTLDMDRVLAAMVRVIDTSGVRIGSEVYADENDSYGLTTLTRRHIAVDGTRVRLRFPAKSGRRSDVSFRDAGVSRLVRDLLAQRAGKRLFMVDGEVVDADQVNAALATWTGAHITAKDFRTWHGTRVAFEWLEDHRCAEDDPDSAVRDAVDAAAEWLGNTRAVARGSYVHPAICAGAILDSSSASPSTPRAPTGLSATNVDCASFSLPLAREPTDSSGRSCAAVVQPAAMRHQAGIHLDRAQCAHVGQPFLWLPLRLLPRLGNRFRTAAVTFFCSAGVPCCATRASALRAWALSGIGYLRLPGSANVFLLSFLRFFVLLRFFDMPR